MPPTTTADPVVPVAGTPAGGAAGDRGTTSGAAPAGEAAPHGVLFGVGAYLIWGVMPLYFPLLAPASPLEIIGHRIAWTLVFCFVLLAVTRGFPAYVALLRDRRTLLTLAAAEVLVVANWTLYVHAVLTERVLEAALGYFINPILTVVLAVVVLGERLRTVQWVAVGLGVAAVAVMGAGVDGVPWIALGLATAFGLYGLLKKRVGARAGAVQALAVEATIGFPFAAGYLAWLAASGGATAADRGPGRLLLFAAAGIITGTPLLLFGAAARRVSLSLLGTLQYLGPAIQVLVGLLVFRETLTPERWAGFALVWVAIAVLMVDGARRGRAPRPGAPVRAPAAPSR